MSERIVKLVEMLQGTCMSFSVACEEIGFNEDDLTKDEFSEFDEELFLCEECGWWCERGEESEESQVCDECVEDEE